MPVIHSRADWGAQPPKRSAKLNPSKIGIVDVHWPGSKGHLARDRAGVAAALRGWQAFHMKTRGWSDIAYNIGVDLAGEVWELRGWDAVDGGVASRSDDVTILLIMGDQDQMSDAMKTSVLWVMAEWDRRFGRKLRRTHHSALTGTDCPGPEATAWSKAGFPAPTTNAPTIQEDDMPLNDDDLKKIFNVVWNGAPGLDLIPQYAEGGGAWPATILGAATARVAQQVAPPPSACCGIKSRPGAPFQTTLKIFLRSSSLSGISSSWMVGVVLGAGKPARDQAVASGPGQSVWVRAP